jgi:hypothetical protein
MLDVSDVACVAIALALCLKKKNKMLLAKGMVQMKNEIHT